VKLIKAGLPFCIISTLALLVRLAAAGQELPKPTYQNSVIISIEHDPRDSAAVDSIKQNLPFGLYAWPSFSQTTIFPALDWHALLSDAATGIQAFKDTVNGLIAAAKAKNVKLHLVLSSGLARSVQLYKEAKEEDIRNAQWYNDNKLASDTQIGRDDRMSSIVYGTLSRYARKVRANLYAKSKAALAFLKQKMDENPDTLMAVSGWGEAELNSNRIDHSKSVQDSFCDYSPFAVLEFRDWIQHGGQYDDVTGIYRAQGFRGGGAQYQGDDGRARFNVDFGTNFATWDLRYYHWSLADDYDQSPQDAVNNDPHKIPSSAYSHGNMLPTSGANYIAGGFDPPRVMQPGVKFWELWNFFRETMVNNFVRDVAFWASDAGIPADHWYSHQIPGDYLYGTNPGVPNKNARYYTSASPLWTADVTPFGSVGATIYDIKFPPDVNPVEFVRTTSFVYPDISAMSSNWAAMEYDAETYPVGYTVAQSPADFILREYLRLYSYRVHLINFWRWQDVTIEHTIKGMNKETALKEFIRRIRDKARSADLNVVFSPPKVTGLTGQYVVGGSVAGVQLQLAGKIWDDADWKWKDWGDFGVFEVFRGDDPDFALDTAHRVGTTADYAFTDATALPANAYYYKTRAVNTAGVPGPASDAVLVSGSSIRSRRQTPIFKSG
jgi:hypothetical protein